MSKGIVAVLALVIVVTVATIGGGAKQSNADLGLLLANFRCAVNEAHTISWARGTFLAETTQQPPVGGVLVEVKLKGATMWESGTTYLTPADKIGDFSIQGPYAWADNDVDVRGTRVGYSQFNNNVLCNLIGCDGDPDGCTDVGGVAEQQEIEALSQESVSPSGTDIALPAIGAASAAALLVIGSSLWLLRGRPKSSTQ